MVETPAVDARVEERGAEVRAGFPSPRSSRAVLDSARRQQTERTLLRSPTSPTRRVLDEKSQLMLEVLQDYGPYSPRREYSCRSLPKPRSEDFVLRHNAQNIHDFKQAYSKSYGTLNRKPPQFALNCPPTSPYAKRPPSPPHPPAEPLWKQSKPNVWVLTEHGLRSLVGVATPHAAPPRLLPSIAKRPPEASSFQAHAQVGSHIDLSKDNEFASLVRLHHYSPRTTPLPPSTAHARNAAYALSMLGRPSTSPDVGGSPGSGGRRPMSSEDRAAMYGFFAMSSSPSKSPLRSPKKPASPPKPEQLCPSISLKHMSLMEVEPSIINFDRVRRGQTYHFPIKIRNFGTKQERFRVRSIALKAGGAECSTVQVEYDREKAKIAPGLSAMLLVIATFERSGAISGVLDIESPSGKCGLAVIGTVESS
ncbi:hypothetical protein SPRG_01205 [Saprolegnia parasitica CBS 223.65]|uniref:Uncharacterized protein n=1 Tax=Saprolegnia parasitica (strain CBS 223.65) TaxID=695850 RepID=A0A067CXC2_SAPPC|nr:hypothetical protein SPRG_01205 [Saprolegnia parasitica CBS 223.65]KDO35138.1 hypothetical protein SPRG_01205 [Saprolegnia parasitica CBS 223.65]|eukprot:XP_012194787.1 hypothetical protein SPRG_01205 [Saprolegnia parasitica CBS 223.65]